jgi:putative FmdB family regulatory protein
MPIYEYRCDSCAYLFDVLQKVSDAPLKECPECGALELRRLISAPSFRLKGGGWYETDFKSDKERKRNLAERRDSDSKESGGGEKAASDDKADKGHKSDKADTADKSQKAKAKAEDRKKKSGGKGTDNAVA